jgi:hypothetical protein
MIVVAIYILPEESSTYKRIELFSDEKISVTSSVQDISDISKTFTDFSQSFTVPATVANNAIFKHWYENDVDNGFDGRKRKNAYIELDTIPFRKGTIQLEKAQFKNGNLDNYQITFFGSIVSLKDRFNNLSLKDVDFSSLYFNYSGSAVKDRISISDNDVSFPLISSKNVWTYGTNGTDVINWDISKSDTPIYYNDLFPAVRLNKIIEAIGSTIGVNFVGNFLNDDKFKRAFLWFKNANEFIPVLAPSKINFIGVSSTTGSASLFDTANDVLKYVEPTYPEVIDKSFLYITFNASGYNCSVETYKNNVKINEVFFVSQTSQIQVGLPLDGTGDYSFYISSDGAVQYTSYYYFETGIYTPTTYSKVKDLTATQPVPATSSSFLDLSIYAPEIKVEDFFTGVLKTFNLTCYSEDGYNFKVEQLEDWYLAGEIRDLSKYTISDNIEISRSELYKNINFKYAKAENILAVNFNSRSTTPYGDLVYDMDIDGSQYSVELPFSTLLHQKFTGTNLQVGYSLDSNYSPIIPAPVLLYNYGYKRSSSFYFNDGNSTSSKIVEYHMFGQDTNISGQNYTINFGVEQSTYTNKLESNSLFYNYYLDYLSNVFSKKSRLFRLKMILPTGILTSLKLNDRVIIRDKRYIIQKYTTDLTTGEVDLELLTDFRVIKTTYNTPKDYSNLDYSQTDYNA